VFGFINQYSGSTEAEIKEQVFERIEKLINDSVEQLSKVGAAEISKKTVGEGKLDKALRFAQGLKSLGFIKDFAVDKKGRITVDRLTLEEMPTPSEDMLSDGEREVYRFMRDWFDNHVDDFERVTRNVWGKDFKRENNYMPMIPMLIHGMKMEDADSQLDDSMDLIGTIPNRLSSKESNRQKSRSNLAGADKYYDVDIVEAFLNSAHQVLQATRGGRGMRAMVKIVNSGDFGRFLRGENAPDKDTADRHLVDTDDIKYYRTALKEIVQDTKHAPFLFPNRREAASKFLQASLGHMVKLFLNRLPQAALQYIPNFYMTAQMTSPQATAIATAWQFRSLFGENRTKYEKFLSNFSGAFRSAQGLPVYDKFVNTNPSLRQEASHVAGWVTGVKEGELSLRLGDKGAFNLSIIAGYIDYLVRTGKIESAHDFDIEADIDPGAFAYAETFAAKVNNESNRAYRPQLVKGDKLQKGNAFATLYLLMGFSINAATEAMNSARTMFDKRATLDQRLEAANHVQAYAGQIVIFNLLRAHVINQIGYMPLAKAAVAALYGYVPKEESEEKKRKKKQERNKRLVIQMMADGMLGAASGPAQAFVKDVANAGWKVGTEAGAELGEKPPFFTDGPGGPAGMLVEGVDIFTKAFVKSKDKKLTRNQRKAVDELEIAKAVSLLINAPDVFRLTDNMIKQVKESKKQR
jgi:hypothetical protein